MPRAPHGRGAPLFLFQEPDQMFEKLENRRLLAAHIDNPGVNGVLTVDGSTGSDTIACSIGGTGGDDIVVTIGGVGQNFDTSLSFDDGEFHKMVINGDQGNDTVTFTVDIDPI